MPALKSQLATAKTIHRRTGRTFHLATRLLPRRVRDQTHVLYAFFRIADDVVDDPDPTSTSAQRRKLRSIRAQALGEEPPSGDVMEAFATLREEYDLDPREIEIFLDAMAMDLEQTRYETTAELHEYLRGSSVAVANLLLDVFAPEIDPAARPHATALAEALQLTNFLRDVREDRLDYDRIYLPRETLAEHGTTVEEIESLEFTEPVGRAIKEELERTETLYREGVAGIEYLPADVQFGVLLAAVLYADHHRLIREQGYDVLSRRPELSTARRLSLAARTWFHWRRLGDPVDVFERVSALPSDAPTDSSEETLSDPRDQITMVLSEASQVPREWVHRYSN